MRPLISFNKIIYQNLFKITFILSTLSELKRTTKKQTEAEKSSWQQQKDQEQHSYGLKNAAQQ